MAGTASIDARHGENEHWGPHVFLTASGDAEAVRDEYARRAPEWPSLHFAVAEASPEELDPWYRLGFAQMHAYGMRESGAERVDVPGVAIRRGGPADLELALRVDRLIYDAQAAPPSYSAFPLDAATHRADWVKTLGADDVGYFVAERAGEPVGHATIYPDPQDAEALHLASTAVLPAARGSGVAAALTAHALAHTAGRGYPRLRTNWRVTNLAASRFWPARGFRLTHIRLVRRLPEL